MAWLLASIRWLLASIHAHPLLWIAGALVVGFIVGQELTAAEWNAEKRRLRKRLGIATLEDYFHND